MCYKLHSHSHYVALGVAALRLGLEMSLELFQKWSARFLGAEKSELAATFHPYTEQCETGAVLLGVGSDLSLGRHRGRLGDNEGPESISTWAAKMLPPSRELYIYDAGVIESASGLTFKELQSELYSKVTGFLVREHLPILLGGGHEISIASYKALSDYIYRPDRNTSETQECSAPKAQHPRIGIINFDAHFELRKARSPKVGSVFYSVANYCADNHRPFDYLGLGICERSNSQAIFMRAEELGCQWILDRQMKMRNLREVFYKVERFLNHVDYVHVSFDLSVFSADVASGVNLSRLQGVDWPIVEQVLKLIVNSGKVKVLDVVEYNPEFDDENQTAKVAARVVNTILGSISA